MAPRRWPTGPTLASATRGHAWNALVLLPGYAAPIGVTRLEAHVATGNHASRRVAEAAGFRRAGTLTDEDGTAMIRYARDVMRPCGAWCSRAGWSSPAW
jgi:RimJ/RimL family protein N-acetyltransferase